MNNDYSISVIPDSDKAKVFYTNFNGQNFCVVPKKGAYKISIRNNTNRPVAMTVTVDGLNVLNGEPGSYKGMKYFVPPHTTTTIPGWQRSNNEASAFLFTGKDKSYANRSGNGTTNTGVIGLAVFSVVSQPTKLVQSSRVESLHNRRFMKSAPTRSAGSLLGNPAHTNTVGVASSGPEMFSTANVDRSMGVDYEPLSMDYGSRGCRVELTSSVASSVGTGWGHQVQNRVEEVSVKVESIPFHVYELRYSTKQDLIDAGWVPSTQPSGFPQETNKFCQPPRY